MDFQIREQAAMREERGAMKQLMDQFMQQQQQQLAPVNPEVLFDASSSVHVALTSFQEQQQQQQQKARRHTILKQQQNLEDYVQQHDHDHRPSLLSQHNLFQMHHSVVAEGGPADMNDVTASHQPRLHQRKASAAASALLPEPMFSLDDVEKALAAAAAAAAVSAVTVASDRGATASHQPVSNANHEAELQFIDSSALPSESLRYSSASLPSWAHLIARSNISGILSQVCSLLCLLFLVPACSS
jgi:hypothetical protein